MGCAESRSSEQPATGAPRQVIEISNCAFSQSLSYAGVEGSSPSLSTSILRHFRRTSARRISIAGDLREVRSQTFSEAAIRLPISAAQ